MSENALPLDWNEWERVFYGWVEHHGISRSREGLGLAKTLLADEIMGCYLTPSGVVEISAVTFPNLTDRDEHGFLIHRTDRKIGLTWKNTTHEAILVDTLAEMNTAVGIADD